MRSVTIRILQELLLGCQIKYDETGGAFSTHRREEKYIKNCNCKISSEETTSETFFFNFLGCGESESIW
jgi:hypothetical protein